MVPWRRAHALRGGLVSFGLPWACLVDSGAYVAFRGVAAGQAKYRIGGIGGHCRTEITKGRQWRISGFWPRLAQNVGADFASLAQNLGEDLASPGPGWPKTSPRIAQNVGEDLASLAQASPERRRGFRVPG